MIERTSSKGVTVLLAATVMALAPVVASAGEAAARDGKTIFLAEKCNTCHAVSTAGIEHTTKSEKMAGPDLSACVASHERDWVVKYLRKELDKDGKKHGKEVKLSEPELKVLVDWLFAQKKP